ncbi:MAG: hypothetical protein GWM90_28810, partial [Gemmatimonadetes bacterium]|nr:hypothetical protein [Gemmatimonadota bacterium]NIQ59038.1 hypothetical protein [Gemmatimonadota bacterium]NIU79246.1 hypothetical protein [Gammaproteobacteria bacterium]NIX47927.1 hypothetical protein [Gemmatimonadota bacterium]NIY12292.1 hypothetical protein [Gemmatimonadota bacterium]
IYHARRAGADGVALLSARLINEGDLWDALRTGPFKREVPVPDMPWLPAP